MLTYSWERITWQEWLLYAAILAAIAGVSYVISIARRANARAGGKSALLSLVFGTLFLASLFAASFCVIMTFINFFDVNRIGWP